MEAEISLSCSQGPPIYPIVSQMNEVNILQPYFSSFRSNITFHLH